VKSGRDRGYPNKGFGRGGIQEKETLVG